MGVPHRSSSPATRAEYAHIRAAAAQSQRYSDLQSWHNLLQRRYRCTEPCGLAPGTAPAAACCS